jgi:hypothetical protein
MTDYCIIVANGDGLYLVPYVVEGQQRIVLDHKYAAFAVK